MHVLLVLHGRSESTLLADPLEPPCDAPFISAIYVCKASQKIILRAADGESHGAIARALGISKARSRRWRPRWRELSGREFSVSERWQDAYRTPPLDAGANHHTVGLSLGVAGTVWPSDESLDTRRTDR